MPRTRRRRLAVAATAVSLVAGPVVLAGCATERDVTVATTEVAPDIASTLVATGDVGSTATDAAGPPTSPGGLDQSTATTVPTAEKSIVTSAPDADGDGVSPVGFGRATVRITAADGSVCEVCLWLADESGLRSTGLKGVTDLGGPVGMVFAYDPPATLNFVMVDTPTPLSIAWFDADGRHLSEIDMDPCPDDTDRRCERFNTTGPYQLAIEMFRTADGSSQLDRVGIGPGSAATIVDTFPLGATPPPGSVCDFAR